MTSKDPPMLNINSPEALEQAVDHAFADRDSSRFAETTLLYRFTVKPFFAWYDWWIGAYWDRQNRQLHLCPLPMIGVKIVIPRNAWKEFRRHWSFVVIAAVVGVAIGLAIGASVYRKEMKTIVFDSPAPSVGVSVSAAPASASFVPSASAVILPEPAPSSSAESAVAPVVVSAKPLPSLRVTPPVLSTRELELDPYDARPSSRETELLRKRK